MSGREKPLILQNGIPIPQAYDKDLGDWTEYSTEHIKAIKAELALVKSELEAIKANQLSGDQKVQLSGQIAANWEVVASGVPLVAGETWLSELYDASDTIKTDVALRLRDNRHFNVAVNSYGAVGDVNFLGTKTIYETESVIAYALMSFENEAPYFQLRITNTHANDTVIVRLYKRQVRHLA